MKALFCLMALLLLPRAGMAQVPHFNVSDPAFVTAFTKLYKGTSNAFADVRGRALMHPTYHDTAGYQLLVPPPGATDLQPISLNEDGSMEIFFKLGNYSPDSAAVALTMENLIVLVKRIAREGVVLEEDTSSPSDTRIRELNGCRGAEECNGDDYIITLFHHRRFNKTWNIAVTLRWFPPDQ